jgi:hypothetical protein
MRKIKWMAGSCLALALAFLALGCSGSSAGKAAPFEVVKGQHPTNWISVHYSEFVKNPDQCRTCHGSTSVPAQGGGISKVSCFTCHTAVEHPTNWADPAMHGRLGAQLPPSASPTAMVGFAHCAKCHGSDYAGGISKISCKSCHTLSPHPDKPWHGTTATKTNHTATNSNNAGECYTCHKDGANSTIKPLTPPAAGATPGCFNNTMCHAT